MATLAERSKSFLQNLVRTPTQLPTRVIIPSSHVDEGRPVEAFIPHEHYFQVRINEMYLLNSREWIKDYRPMVFVVSEYDYGYPTSGTTTVPFVVGPSMMAKYKMPVPDDMIFTDTRVAGLHPYRGGAINLSVILYKVSSQDYARQLLQLVENAVSVVDVSTTFTTYLKLAGVVLDGIEELFGLQDTVPLLGWSKSIDPDANDRLEPHYTALIDLPESTIDLQSLWVVNNQLRKGRSRDESKPFREASYVLYQLVQTAERGDLSRLSFYDLYAKMQLAANTRDAKEYRRATALMTTLAGDLLLCPDLTQSQAEKLDGEYRRKMQRLHDNKVKGITAGPGDHKAPGELERKLRDTVDILDL